MFFLHHLLTETFRSSFKMPGFHGLHSRQPLSTPSNFPYSYIIYHSHLLINEPPVGWPSSPSSRRTFFVSSSSTFQAYPPAGRPRRSRIRSKHLPPRKTTHLRRVGLNTKNKSSRHHPLHSCGHLSPTNGCDLSAPRSTYIRQSNTTMFVFITTNHGLFSFSPSFAAFYTVSQPVISNRHISGTHINSSYSPLVFISFQLTKLKQSAVLNFFPFYTTLSFKELSESEGHQPASQLRVKADSSANTYTRVSAVTPSRSKVITPLTLLLVMAWDIPLFFHYHICE